MTATLIHVDWKARTKLYSEQLTNAKGERPSIDVAANKRMVNDLKGLLDDNLEMMDLYPAFLVIPCEGQDMFVKLNGTDVTEQDEILNRVSSKMRDQHVKS